MLLSVQWRHHTQNIHATRLGKILNERFNYLVFFKKLGFSLKAQPSMLSILLFVYVWWTEGLAIYAADSFIIETRSESHGL